MNPNLVTAALVIAAGLAVLWVNSSPADGVGWHEGLAEQPQATLRHAPTTLAAEAMTLLLLEQVASGGTTEVLSARIAARGCGQRRAALPSAPAFQVVGVMKSGTTDLHARLQAGSWVDHDTLKESHWFEQVCKASMSNCPGGDRLYNATTGDLLCPPPPSQHRKAAAAQPLQGARYADSTYKQGSTAWHYQRFFQGGQFECAKRSPRPLQQVPGLWRALPAFHTTPPQPAGGDPDTDALWTRHEQQPWLSGWKVLYDASPKLLPLAEGMDFLRGFAPAGRVLYQYRHPVDRAWSHYFHARSTNSGDRRVPVSSAGFEQEVRKEERILDRWGERLSRATSTSIAALQGMLEAVLPAVARASAEWPDNACVAPSVDGNVSSVRCKSVLRVALAAGLWVVEEVALTPSSSSPGTKARSWHMPPAAPPDAPPSLVQAAWLWAQAVARDTNGQLAAPAARLRLSLSQVNTVWRSMMLTEYKVPNFSNVAWGGTMLVRGLYAAQHLRLLASVPAADILPVQATEYFRDVKAVLTGISSWLCAPLEQHGCEKGHPFFNNSAMEGGLVAGPDVVARPSRAAYAMPKATERRLLRRFAPFIRQHAQLLDVLDGTDARGAAEACLAEVRRRCGLTPREQGKLWRQGTNGAAACLISVLRRQGCAHVPLGPLSPSIALQASEGESGAAASWGNLRALHSRWNRTHWDSAFMRPGELRHRPAYLATLLGGPSLRGQAAYTEPDIAAALQWGDCAAA